MDLSRAATRVAGRVLDTGGMLGFATETKNPPNLREPAECLPGETTTPATTDGTANSGRPK